LSRLDVIWGSGPDLREVVWSWRSATRYQVVNPDIDGLLTACLLYHVKKWPIVGFYDTERLFLDVRAPVPLELDALVWVDIDMCWPGTRSLSQHVITEQPSDRATVKAYSTTVNPSLLRGHSRTHAYSTKYPFGTFQWAWWLIGGAAGRVPSVDDPVATGLAWMPDGGFQSVRDRWRDNCLNWATTLMPGGILEPIARHAPDDALLVVQEAERALQTLSGVTDGWRNHQFSLTRGSSTGPVLTLPLEEVLPVLRALCHAIADLYGWDRAVLPDAVDIVRGHWRKGDRPPAGWPHCANERGVVSLAVTGTRQMCWTEPGDLDEVLPRAMSTDAP
jgi:hypothetical protein